MEYKYQKIGKTNNIRIHINKRVLIIEMLGTIIILQMLCKMRLMDVFRIKIIIIVQILKTKMVTLLQYY